MLVALVALIAEAEAADLVLHTGDPAGVADKVAAATSRSAADFTPTEWTGWLASKQTVLTAGELEVCTGDATDAERLASKLTVVEAAVGDLDFETAGFLLTQIDGAMLCLGQPLDAKQVSRIYFLRGLAAHFGKDPKAAREAFSQAFLVDPTMEWDMNFPPSARTEFDNAKDSYASGAKVGLAILPRTAAISIDGKPATITNGRVELTEGKHLIQVGGEAPITVRVTLDADTPGTLLVPHEMPAEALSWAGDATLGPDLARFIATVEPGNTPYVVNGEDVWKGSPVGWSRISSPITQDEPPMGLYVLGTGGAVFVTGSTLALTGLAAGNAAIRDGEAEGVRWEDWEDASGRYDRARGRLIAGEVIAVTGLAIAGAGGYLMSQQMSVGPMWVPHGAGIGFTWQEKR